MSEPSEYGQRGLERHFQTGIQLIIMGLLAWNFTTVQQMAVTIGRNDVKIEALAEQIKLLALITNDRYREKDAERDFLIRDSAILAIDNRLQDVEKRTMALQGPRR